MAKVRIELNRAGVREMMRSAEMQGVLEEVASPVMTRLGAGYGQDSRVGKNRCNVSIHADSEEAKRDNMENNTLLKAVSG